MSDVLRFARRVPDEGAGLAWIEMPPLDPAGNISLVEVGKYVAENRDKVWDQALGSDVVGLAVTTTAVTGNIYRTTYNPAPSGGSPISSGVATYISTRGATTAVSPSGFIVENFTTQIRVLPPVENRIGVWRLRIQDGLVKRDYTLRSVDSSWLSQIFNVGDQLVVYYSVPEISYIPYMSEGPSGSIYRDYRVLDVSGALAEILDEHTIQLPTGDLVEVLALTVNGNAVITSSSGQLFVEGGIQPSQVPPRGPFTAWDPLGGVLTLSRTLQEEDQVLVNYRYREFLYLYEGYPDDNGTFHNLNFSPFPGHSYDSGRPTTELLNIPVYLYLLPTAAYRVRNAAGVVDQERKLYSGLRWHKSFLRWERTAASIEVNEAPFESHLSLRRSTFGFDYWDVAEFADNIPVDNLPTTSTTGGSGLAYLPSALVLAKVYLTSNAQIENVDVIDTRLRGGGIPDSVNVEDPILPGETRREIETYWDISGWDGQPVPLAGVLVVELPSAILTGDNGLPQFTQQEIVEIVRQHVAAGVKVVVKYV